MTTTIAYAGLIDAFVIAVIIAAWLLPPECA